jgi:hypothetical protein
MTVAKFLTICCRLQAWGKVPTNAVIDGFPRDFEQDCRFVDIEDIAIFDLRLRLDKRSLLRRLRFARLGLTWWHGGYLMSKRMGSDCLVVGFTWRLMASDSYYISLGLSPNNSELAGVSIRT